MQMIDVLKRLAELDANNPNIVKENVSVEECGPMGMMGGMEKPSTPATLNITADNGEELGSMLATIMKLAGVQQVTPDQLGVEHEPSIMTAEPVAAVGPSAPEMSSGDDMRNMMSVVDKLNPEGGDDEGEEETDEGQYDNSPADPTDVNPFDSNEFANHPNDGSTHGRATKNNPHGNPMGHETEKKQEANMTMEEQLMDEYKNFINEAKECKVCHEPMKKCKCD
jgi:hypothetical protein